MILCKAWCSDNIFTFNILDKTMKAHTYYVRSTKEYKDIPYGVGKVLSLRSGVTLTLILTDPESRDLMLAMPGAQFIRDNKIPPRDVPDVVSAPAPLVSQTQAVDTVPAETVEEKSVEPEPEQLAEFFRQPANLTEGGPPAGVPLPALTSKDFGWADSVRKISGITNLRDLEAFMVGETRSRPLASYKARREALSRL